MGLTNRNTLNPFSKKNISIIEESIKQVGLKDQIDKNINDLSGVNCREFYSKDFNTRFRNFIAGWSF